MTDSQTLPVVGAAVTAPAWIPTLATIAPPLLLGAGIAAALVWLLRDDTPKADAPAPDGHAPPTPAPRQERGFWDTFWNGGWGFDDDAPATAAPALPETERQQRIRDNEAEIARERQAIARLKAEQEKTRKQLATARARNTPAVSRQSVETASANSRSRLPDATPAPISAPQVAVTPRSPVAPAVSPAPAVIHQAAPVPAVAVTAPRQSAEDGSANSRSRLPDAAPAPGKFQLFTPKVNREDLAAVFADGKRLSRKDAVAALRARGVKQTTAYNALRDGGRFADLLTVGEDGLLAFNG